MNNRYLYRAKRTDNGEWIEGYYAYAYGKHYIMTVGATCALPPYHWYFEKHEVDPSTICRCTGIKDKNGKLIWENDICRRILLPTKRIKTNFRIAYVPYKCCLTAIDLEGSNVTFLSDYINNQYEVEVIGNIFDNPELLEVGE